MEKEDGLGGVWGWLRKHIGAGLRQASCALASVQVATTHVECSEVQLLTRPEQDAQPRGECLTSAAGA